MSRISKYSYQIINNLCNQSETLISKSSLLNMKNMETKHRILIASQFIHNELPIRLARRVKDLEQLPLQLDSNHEIFKIRDWYLQSLDDITLLPKPLNQDQCIDTNKVVQKIYNRHCNTLTTMACGIDKLKKNNLINNNIDHFLTKFNYNRTRTRFLINNYLDYYKNNIDTIGSLNTKCEINNIINSVLEDINAITEVHRIKMPEIKLNIPNKEFLYTQSYIHYALIEIIKNSIVATKNMNNPLIEINGYVDNNYIILKISDNGIGIDKKHMDDIWKFSFTTTKINFDNTSSNHFEKQNPLSGLGYGLPISRIILQTFNGDIKIFSKQNIGTDTYLFIDIASDWKC